MLVGRRLAGTVDMSMPSIKIVPDVGTSRPASSRSRVVLPQPEGPSSEKNSPCLIPRLTSSTAVTAAEMTASRDPVKYSLHSACSACSGWVTAPEPLGEGNECDGTDENAAAKCEDHRQALRKAQLAEDEDR